MERQVRPNILKIKPYVPGKPIEEVRRQLGLKEVIKLASNENCLGPSPKAVAAIRRALSCVNRYPDGASFSLRRKMAKFLDVGEDRLIFGNGSDEIICMAARAFVGEGDEVVISKPAFLIYEIAAQAQNAKIAAVPAAAGLKHDLKAMASAVTGRTKIIFIANPDNPTGTYVTKKELDAFLAAVPSSVVVFLDEAYFEFAAASAKDYPDGLDYIDRPNVIVSRSFSKAYGLAGVRAGYGVSTPAMIGFLERTREPFNVNLLAQAAAEAAIGDTAFLKKTLKIALDGKKRLYTAFGKMGLPYIESATNFVLVDVKRDCKEVFAALLKRGVIVRDMKAWGMDTFIRVTVGTPAENARFIDALAAVVKN
jgi:histidinol-phosphate aminotransferase